jgi:hypothetical protein
MLEGSDLFPTQGLKDLSFHTGGGTALLKFEGKNSAFTKRSYWEVRITRCTNTPKSASTIEYNLLYKTGTSPNYLTAITDTTIQLLVKNSNMYCSNYLSYKLEDESGTEISTTLGDISGSTILVNTAT